MANRVLKFKVWNTASEKMSGPFLINQPMGINSNSIILQFTGLNDKAGKEIYEGDVVKRYNITKVVKWHEGYAYCGWNIGKGYNYKSQNTVEVIGNIYQNPELLTNK